MRCEEVREIIADRLAGTLDKAIEAGVREHLQECPMCRSELEGIQSIWAEMASIPTPLMQASRVRSVVLEAAGPTQYQFVLRRWNMRSVLKATAIILILAGLAAGASLWLGKRPESRPESRPEKNSASVPVSGHMRGDAAAPATLLEYGDYECSPCGSFEPIIKKLLEKYPGALKLEFRHFPLTRLHPNALLAAKAAEAAADQGQFWMMHDRLMSSRSEWTKNPAAESLFIDMAKELGLDVESFRKAVGSPETEARILKGAAQAERDGITAAPTFYLNGKKIEQASIDFDAFDKLIIDELKR
jgi:protein-disulfide isomerase